MNFMEFVNFIEKSESEKSNFLAGKILTKGFYHYHVVREEKEFISFTLVLQPHQNASTCSLERIYFY